MRDHDASEWVIRMAQNTQLTLRLPRAGSSTRRAPCSTAPPGLAWGLPRYILGQVDETWRQSAGEDRAVVRRGDHLPPARPSSRAAARQGQGSRGQLRDGDRGCRRAGQTLARHRIRAGYRSQADGAGGQQPLRRHRDAWDTGNLSTLTRNSPLRATGAHLSIVGHITEPELHRYLTEMECANGFANRFLWLLVRRSKLLPDGPSAPDAKLAPLIDELREVVRFAGTLGELARDEAATASWRAVYGTLTREEPGMVGAVIGRAERFRCSACRYCMPCWTARRKS
jgi:hypothetical protein